MMMRRILPLLLSLLFSFPCRSTDFDTGLAAFVRGDFATAFRTLEPLADQGDADAQFALGAMYSDGQGVVKDYVTAHMWGVIAWANGSDNGRKLVDLLEPLIFRTQIAAAKERASACVARQYREC
jgi:TPR repeat protein